MATWTTQTAQEQVASRAASPQCGTCHASFDPYGLVLDWYDVVGRYRTVDDLGKPVDGRTKLPAEVGGAEIDTAVELADVLSKSDVFTNCLAKSVLDDALVGVWVELPLPSHQQAGCAAAGVADNLRRSEGRLFTDLFRAAATSPSFVLRTVDASVAYDDMPADTGGSRSAPPVPGDPVLANLSARRTVLDFVAQELDGLRRIRPTDVRAKLDNHYNAVMTMQSALTAAIDAFKSN